MKETVVKALIDGLYGKNTHLNPKKVIEGLTPANAKIKPENDNHSCWELLHHLKIWQKAILEALIGKEVDWKDISKNHNWPNADYLSDDQNFINLVKMFKNGLLEAEKLIKTTDLHKPMPAWDDAPVIQAIIVLLQHNSYHYGQIVAVRKSLGIWP
ncbi:MAG: DinB family protein [Candidatus Hodarchaeales archaeon]